MKIFKQNYPLFLIFPLIMLISALTYGQSVEVILSKENLIQKTGSNEKQECYKIALKNKSGKPVGLAGQNYRLYYNSDAVILDEGSIQSYLPKSYSPLQLVQHNFDVDATGFGVLPFDNHLGFINLANDYNLSSAAPVMIGVGETVDVAQLCLNITDESQESQITWAREDLTQTYATAFVEIATVEGTRLKKMHIDGLSVLGTRTSLWQEGSVLGLEYFPNPFKDHLEIKFNHALNEQAHLEVMDIFGSLLQSKDLNNGTSQVTIDGADLPGGALLIKIRQGDGDTAIFKAIKIK